MGGWTRSAEGGEGGGRTWVAAAAVGRQPPPRTPSQAQGQGQATFVLFLFDDLVGACPFMYVDNMCVIISSRYVSHPNAILNSMHRFGKVSGLNLSVGKSTIVLKGMFTHTHFKNCGLPIEQHVKYLGVRIGNISVSQAFSRVL